MGDASWDYKNGTVADEYYADWHWSLGTGATLVWKNDEHALQARGDRRTTASSSPRMQWQSPFGHAASDNYFAAVNGFDDAPEMAVGRFPVVTLEEAQAIVDKSLGGHAPGDRRPSPGALFITDDIVVSPEAERPPRRRRPRRRAGAPTRIYPKEEEMDNTRHTRAILDAFDEGQSIVVFAGHGGRYIWRTGPPDLKKNHDLFTLAHLDELTPGDGAPRGHQPHLLFRALRPPDGRLHRREAAPHPGEGGPGRHRLELAQPGALRAGRADHPRPRYEGPPAPGRRLRGRPAHAPAAGHPQQLQPAGRPDAALREAVAAAARRHRRDPGRFRAPSDAKQD